MLDFRVGSQELSAVSLRAGVWVSVTHEHTSPAVYPEACSPHFTPCGAGGLLPGSGGCEGGGKEAWEGGRRAEPKSPVSSSQASECQL